MKNIKQKKNKKIITINVIGKNKPTTKDQIKFKAIEEGTFYSRDLVSEPGNVLHPDEYAKRINALKKIGLNSLTNNYQSYSFGQEREIIDLKYQKFSLKILPLICYEIIYSGKLFKDSNFDIIVNISEDGWFGRSVGPSQHFTHSIFRAIESGKYVLRSANNGSAAIINPLGQIEKNINFGQSGYVDLEGSKSIQPTTFSKFGNKIFLMLILLYIFLIFSFNKFKKWAI